MFCLKLCYDIIFFFIKNEYVLGYLYVMGSFYIYLRIIFILDGRLIDFIELIFDDCFLNEMERVYMIN